MTDIYQTLALLAGYYAENSNVGHTELTMRGLASNEFGKIIVTEEKEKYIRPEFKDRCLTLEEFLEILKKGDNIHDPIVIDNHVLSKIFLDVITEFRYLY
jgi:hypothetical protein